MKTLVLTIAAAVLLVGGGFLGRLIGAKPDLAPQLAASEARAAALERQVQALRDSQASLHAEVEALHARLSSTKPAPVRSTAAKAPVAATTTPAPAAGAKPFEKFAEMMKNPAMREMAKKQQTAMRDMMYGDLYTALHFNDEDKAYFKELLAARADADTELGFQLMDTTLTPEARQAAIDENKQQKASSDADIRAFLDNDSDFQTFTHYEQTSAERMMLTMNKAAFDAEPLTPDQETQLIDTMHDVATRSGSTANPMNSKTFDPSQFSQATMDQQLQTLDNNAQAVRAAATAFLSPGQQAILKQVQDNQRAMTSAGFEMMKSFGNGGK